MADIDLGTGPKLEGFRVMRRGEDIEEIHATYMVRVASTEPYIYIAFYAAGMPRPGDPFSHPSIPGVGGTNELIDELRLEEQEERFGGFDDDGLTIVFVDCIFRRQLILPRVVSGNSGLQQITTETLKDGSQAIVEYNGRQQGGELSVFQPTAGFTIRVTEATDTPEQEAADWVGVVNSSPFLGGATASWMVVDADYEPVLLNSPSYTDRYNFEWRFEYNPDGWEPTAVYKNPETGDIPADLVDGTGIKTFEYYDRGNLNYLFRTRSF